LCHGPCWHPVVAPPEWAKREVAMTIWKPAVAVLAAIAEGLDEHAPAHRVRKNMDRGNGVFVKTDDAVAIRLGLIDDSVEPVEQATLRGKKQTSGPFVSVGARIQHDI